MTTITIDELEARLREVVDRIASGGEPVSITRDGVAVAEINPTAEAVDPPNTPTPPWTEEERMAYWAEWDRIGVEVAKSWPDGVSALDAIREDRSRLDGGGGRDES